MSAHNVVSLFSYFAAQGAWVATGNKKHLLGMHAKQFLLLLGFGILDQLW